jgi:hypothetical protein
MSTEINYNNFWQKLADNWKDIYNNIISKSEKEYNIFAHQGDNKESQKTKLENILFYINSLLCDELKKYIEIEYTIGEINRTYYNTKYDNIVELYISPKLKKENIIYMNKLYDAYIVNQREKSDIYKKLEYLTVVKYKAYNIKDALIEDINYDNYIIKYDDFGSQTFIGYNEEKLPVLNLVLYVKKPICDRILKKKKISVIMPDGSTSDVEKWLPHETTAFDIILLNIVGEYNFIHNIGYIEFLPEGDPLISEGSIFTELNDIRKQLLLLEKIKNINICSVCDRRELQKNILMCSKCKKIKYCGYNCQTIDYKTHKTFC